MSDPRVNSDQYPNVELFDDLYLIDDEDVRDKIAKGITRMDNQITRLEAQLCTVTVQRTLQADQIERSADWQRRAERAETEVAALRRERIPHDRFVPAVPYAEQTHAGHRTRWYDVTDGELFRKVP